MKTFQKFLPLALALCALTCAAKGNDPVARQIKVEPFTSIETECVDVYVTFGDAKNSITVTGPSEILDKFSASQSGDVLTLSCVKKTSGRRNPMAGLLREGKKPVVKITVPSLSGIKADMCSRVIVDGPVSAENMELTCETSSLVKIPSLTASGVVSMNAGMSSTVDVKSLSAKSVALNSATSSTIQTDTINTENLDATAEAGGKINAHAGKVIFADVTTDSDGKVNFDGVSVVSSRFKN